MLDQLSRLAEVEPGSPLVGHLDLAHVGIAGHSLGGATAVQVMAADPRLVAGVNLDGKLFDSQPDARSVVAWSAVPRSGRSRSPR